MAIEGSIPSPSARTVILAKPNNIYKKIKKNIYKIKKVLYNIYVSKLSKLASSVL
jgi:hypothetical protein